MKKIAILSLAAMLSLSCNAQENKNEDKVRKAKDSITEIVEAPKGTWKVDKEFDENGNLIRYDSIYSWSSTDKFNQLYLKNPDSLLKSFQSRFYKNFSGIDDKRFGDPFADDSLFTKRFFDHDFFGSDFGEDFMDIDRLRNKMEAMQQRFLERYRSEFEKQENKGLKKVD